MIWINDRQFATIWEIEDKTTYSLVKMSTSRKDKESGEYKNSNWSYVRFVGEAHKKAHELNRKDRVVIKGGGISLEPYEKNGEKIYPKSPQIVVFNWDWPEEKVYPQNNDMDAPPMVASDEGDYEPF